MYPVDGGIMVKLEIPEYYKTTVVEPFKRGKYSHINRSYVEQHFPKYLSDGNPSINYMILTKDERLKNSMEEFIGQSLPEGAEV